MIDGNLLKIILISMSKSSYVTEITKGLVDETYFSDPSSRLVYKSIVTYYDRYQKLPKEEELHVMIKELYHESYEVNLEDVLNYASDIVNSDKEYEESFVRDQLEKLVKKVRSSRVLDKFVKLVEKGDAVSNESLVEQLKDALDVKIQSAQVFKMTDRSQLLAARERAVGLDDIPKIIKSNFASINSNLQYGGYPPGTVHMIVAPPGTGKSMFLMNEAYSALIQNKRVLHVIIGDLQEYDITIRYLSLVSGLTQTELVLKSVDEQYTMISTINASYNNILDRLHTLEYPAEAITVDQMIADIHNSELQLNVDYDMIIIDYPDNLINTLDNMYKEGGRVYAKLEKLARDTQSVIYVASQPKQSEWNTEIMSLGSASESSKKQASIDTMITMNKPRRDANIGTLHLAKVRKGTVGAAIRYESDMSRCKLQEIDEARYKVLKDNLE